MFFYWLELCAFFINVYIYSCRLVLLTTLVKEVSYCHKQCLMKRYITVQSSDNDQECLVIDETSTLIHSPNIQKTLWKRGHKDYKSWKKRRSIVKCLHHKHPTAEQNIITTNEPMSLSSPQVHSSHQSSIMFILRLQKNA